MLYKNLILSGIGGLAGTIMRYLLAILLRSQTFPIATFLVNITGSFLIGLILGYALKNASFENNYRVLLATGFCGGFTTFSSFTYENIQLLKSGHYGYFLLYMGGSLVIGIFATYLGLQLVK